MLSYFSNFKKIIIKRISIKNNQNEIIWLKKIVYLKNMKDKIVQQMYKESVKNKAI